MHDRRPRARRRPLGLSLRSGLSPWGRVVHLALLHALLAVALQAADRTWDGSNGANWNDAANWVENAVPVSGDRIVFNASSTANRATNNDIAGLTISILVSGDPGGAVSIAGTAFSLDAGGIDASAAAQDLTISANLTLTAGQTWTVADTRTVTASGVITATGRTWVKAGTGTLVVSGANPAVDGGTNLRIDAGLLDLRNSQALGNATADNTSATLNGGNLRLANDANTTFYPQLVLAADGGVTIDRITAGAGGTHTLARGASLGAFTLTVTAGANRTSGTAVLSLSGATSTLTGSAIVDVGAAAQLTMGILDDAAGSFGLTKRGAGAYLANSASTFDGGFVLQAGVVRLASNTGLGTGTITLSGGTLSSSSATGRSTSQAMVIDGTAAVTLGDATNTGTLTFTGSKTVSAAAAVSLASAVTWSSTTTTLNGDLTLSGTGNLTWSGGITWSANRQVTLNGSGTVAITGTTGLLAGGGAANVLTLGGTSTAANTLSLGTNTGSISVNGPELTITTSGSPTLTGSLRDLGGTVNLSLNGNAAGNNGTLTISNDLVLANTTDLTMNVGSSSDQLVVQGSLTLDGQLTVVANTGYAASTYRIADVTGTVTDNTLAPASIPTYTGTIRVSNFAAMKQVKLITTTGAAVLPVWEGDVSSDWGTPGNWSTDSVPDATQIAVFSNASVPNQPTLDANRSVQGIIVGSTSPAITIGGASTLAVLGSGVDAGQDLTFSCPVDASPAQPWTIDSGKTVLCASTVTRSGITGVLTVDGGTAHFQGQVSLTNVSGATVEGVTGNGSIRFSGGIDASGSTSAVTLFNNTGGGLLEFAASQTVKPPPTSALVMYPINSDDIAFGAGITITVDGGQFQIKTPATSGRTITTTGWSGVVLNGINGGYLNWLMRASTVQDLPTDAEMAFDLLLEVGSHLGSTGTTRVPAGRTFGSDLSINANGSSHTLAFLGGASIAGDWIIDHNSSGGAAAIGITFTASSTVAIGGDLIYQNNAGTGTCSFNSASPVAFNLSSAGSLDMADLDGTLNVNLSTGSWSAGGSTISVAGVNTLAAGSGTMTIGGGAGTSTLAITDRADQWGPLVVASNGVLAGGANSTAIGTLGVQSGGTLQPGGSAAASYLKTGNCSLATGSTTALDLGAATTAGTTYDQLQVTGNLTLGGTLSVSNLGGNLATGTYVIATYSGSLSGSFAAISMPTGFSGSIDTATANEVRLAVTVTPYRWTGASGVGSDWTDTANWSTAVVPGASDVAIFDLGAYPRQPALAANASVGGLRFAATSAAVTISGAGTLGVGSSGIDMSASTVDQLVTCPVAVNDVSQTWNIASGRSLTISGALSLTWGTAGTLTVNTGTLATTGPVTFDGHADTTAIDGTGTWAVGGGIAIGVGDYPPIRIATVRFTADQTVNCGWSSLPLRFPAGGSIIFDAGVDLVVDEGDLLLLYPENLGLAVSAATATISTTNQGRLSYTLWNSSATLPASTSLRFDLPAILDVYSSGTFQVPSGWTCGGALTLSSDDELLNAGFLGPATITGALAWSVTNGNAQTMTLTDGTTVAVGGDAVLQAASSHSGTLTVGSAGGAGTGVLAVAGSIDCSDGDGTGATILAPGQATWTAGGNITLAGLDDAADQVQIRAGTTTGRLAATGDLTLGGHLVVSAGAGFGPGTYTIATYGGTLSGSFASVTLPNGYSGEIVSGSGSVRLCVDYPFTWTGAVSTDWSAGGNWVGGAAPGAADSAYFTRSAPARQPALSADTQITGLVMGAVAPAMTIGGTHTLTMTSGTAWTGLDMSAATADLSVQAPLLVHTPGTGTNVDCVWAIASGRTVTLAGGLTKTGNSRISGSLFGTVDLTGPFTVQANTGTDTVVTGAANGMVLRFSGGITVNGPLSASGRCAVRGNLIFAADQTITVPVGGYLAQERAGAPVDLLAGVDLTVDGGGLSFESGTAAGTISGTWSGARILGSGYFGLAPNNATQLLPTAAQIDVQVPLRLLMRGNSAVGFNVPASLSLGSSLDLSTYQNGSVTFLGDASIAGDFTVTYLLNNRTKTITVPSGSTVTVGGAFVPAVSADSTILVLSGATLRCQGGTTSLDGLDTLTLASAGTLVIGGGAGSANLTYSGAATPVTTQAAFSSLNLTVAANGTVNGDSSGAGLACGTMTVQSGGTLRPGGSGAAAIVMTGPCSLDAGATLALDLGSNATPGTTHDQLQASGALALGGADLVVGNLGGNLAAGTYVIATCSGTATGTLAVSMPSGFGGSISTATSGQVRLQVVAAPAITGRTTRDLDHDGQIDAIDVTCDQNLNDAFGGLSATVAGRTVLAIGTGDAANDATFRIAFAESGGADSDAVPDVQITANSTLAESSGVARLVAEGAASTPGDGAKPVLLSALWSDGDGNGVDAGDTVLLTFSEDVSETGGGLVAGDLALPVSGDAWGGFSVAGSGDARTLTLSGSPLLTPGGVYSGAALGDGKPSGVDVGDGSHLRDAALNILDTAGAVVDLGSASNTISIVWVSGGVAPKAWSLGTLAYGDEHNTSTDGIALALRNVGDGSIRLLAKTSDSSPSAWAPAASAGANQFLVKADDAPADPTVATDYALALSTGDQALLPLIRSGQSGDLELFFKSPTSLTVGGGVQQTITITLTAEIPP